MDFLSIGVNYSSSGIFVAIFRRVRFHEKVRKRVQELSLNRAKAARDVDLPASTISNYMTKVESLPRIDIAFKISRALDVPLHWLADDDADWPPPESSLAGVTTQDLTAELGRRFAGVGAILEDLLEEARQTDWIVVAEQILSYDPNAELPKQLKRKIDLLDKIEALFEELTRFNPHATIVPSGQEGTGVTVETSLISISVGRFHLMNRPGVDQVADMASMWKLSGRLRSPKLYEQFSQMKATVRGELEAAKAKAAKRSR